MYLPKKKFFAQRERVKLLSYPKKCCFYSRLYDFLQTMTSQIESSRLSQYVRLYENQLFWVANKSIETTFLCGPVFGILFLATFHGLYFYTMYTDTQLNTGLYHDIF